MKMYEIEDPGQWFTQEQCDKFYDHVIRLVGDQEFLKQVGRNIASCDSGFVKQFVLGLLTPGALYRSLNKIYPNMSRSVESKVVNKKNNEVEIVVAPKEGFVQKPYQCEVAIGMFESVPLMFNDKIAEVKHTRCIHNGDETCCFQVKWKTSKSFVFSKLRNYFLLFSLAAGCLMSFFFPLSVVIHLLAGCLFSSMVLHITSDKYKKKELSEVIVTQGNSAQELLEEAYIQNNYSQLMQNISRATSRTQDVPKIASSVVEIINNHFQYDIAHILLMDQTNKKLIYADGFGLTEKQERVFRKMPVHLSNGSRPLSPVYDKVFKKKEPSLYNASEFSADELDYDIIHLSEGHNVSHICVPVVYKDKCFGLLTVCNISFKKKLEQSDLSVLLGIASQTALSINNANSLRTIDENETKYRKHVIQAQENERRKIAYDLHDNVAQDLGYLKIKCNMILSEIKEVPSTIHEEVNVLSNSLQKTITSLRNIAYDIQPPGLEQFGLTKELVAYCNNFSATHSIRIDFLPVGLDSLDLDFDIQINIYRIISEALTNIHKHSKATRVVINLIASHPLIIFKISDNGIGFDKEKNLSEAIHNKRMGVKSMEERTRLFNGTFRITSRIGSGTQIMIEIPMEQNQFTKKKQPDIKESAIKNYFM